MGVRIDLYAVDVSQFEAFLESSVETVLQEYVNYTSNASGSHFLQHLVNYTKAPTSQEITSEKFFQLKIRSYLRQRSSYDLNFLLQTLSQSSTNFVAVVTTGYRRWWIGSLFDYIERNYSISQQDYSRLVYLWQKVLRGYDCGKSVSQTNFVLSDFEFPIIPSSDVDLLMGVWTEKEAYFVIDCFQRIQQLNPVFGKPPEQVGIAPQNDHEWNEWVHQMIESMLNVEKWIDFENLAMVSFISS